MILLEKKTIIHTVIENGNDKDHEGREIILPDQSNEQKSKL